MANLFYFCHLKKLVRPETFGTYYVSTFISMLPISGKEVASFECSHSSLGSPSDISCVGTKVSTEHC